MLKHSIYCYDSPVEPHQSSISVYNGLFQSNPIYLSNPIYFCSFWSNLVHSIQFSIVWAIHSISVQFGPFDPCCPLWSALFILVYSVHFSDALWAQVCVEREIASLTIMSHSQHNVSRFFIRSTLAMHCEERFA